MPKRYVDGTAISRSDKLLNVEPPSYRAEYAYLLTLALANGTFECVPKKVWSDLYSYNRPDILIEDVTKILDAFERAKMLYRFKALGKIWGFWVKNDVIGRLPSVKEQGKYPCGAQLPRESMRKWLVGEGSPYVADSTGKTFIDETSTIIDETSNTIDETSRYCAGRVELEVELEVEVELDQNDEEPDQTEHPQRPGIIPRLGHRSHPPANTAPAKSPYITNPRSRMSPPPAQRLYLPLATPSPGPQHPASLKILDFMGNADGLREKGPEWDAIATRMEKTYPREDLLAAIDWVWLGPRPFWRDGLNNARDPMVSFENNCSEIVGNDFKRFKAGGKLKIQRESTAAQQVAEPPKSNLYVKPIEEMLKGLTLTPPEVG